MQNSKTTSELHELITKQQWDKITDKDWETLLAALSEKCDWEQMWRLAQIAPAMWSMRLLLRLKEAAWMPEQEAGRAEFTQLVRLAEECAKEEIDILVGRLVYCYATLREHTRDITCMAINPDRQVLIGWSNKDYTVRSWRLPDGTALQPLKWHISSPATCIASIAISPDGQVLAIGETSSTCEDYLDEVAFSHGISFRRFYEVVVSTVRLWSLPDEMAQRSLEELSLIVLGESWKKYLPDGTTYHSLEGHSGRITCLAFSPDGRVLASGSEDHSVRLWRLPNGKALQTLTGHFGSIICLAVSPDGRVLVSGGRDKTIRLWSLPDGAALQVLKGHTSDVTCLAISPNGRVLASGSKDHTLWLWSLPDGKVLKTLKGHTGEVICLAISPDGRVLASGSRDRTIRLWSLPDGAALQVLKGHSGRITCLAISPNGRVLASGSKDGTVRLWKLGWADPRRLIVGQLRLEQLKLLQDTLQKGKVTKAERKWLEFVLAMMHWQRRSDVEVGEASQGIPGGEFDMEIP